MAMTTMTNYKTVCDVVEQYGQTFCRVRLSAPDGTGCVFMIPFDAKTMERFPDVDEEANDEANDIVDGQTEAFARALDTLGWMIVRQCYGHDEVGSKWMLDPKYGPVPGWADGGSPTPASALQIIDGYRTLH